MWFEALTGFKETSPEEVREKIRLEGEYLYSQVNQRRLRFGRLELLRLDELRAEIQREDFPGRIKVEEIVEEVQTLHLDPQNAQALFQAASQFNLLEMVSPEISPEMGITLYEQDRTQGPACAIACGAGTIYRNYFVPLEGQIGQNKHLQMDALRDMGDFLGNEQNRLWTMRNGYALAQAEGLESINKTLGNYSDQEREFLKGLLRIGLQWGTEVTLSPQKQYVSQAYCSALPVAYSSLPAQEWENFARLILEASYEATLYAALINLRQTGSKQVFLTVLGGGAFGNKKDWIFESIGKVLDKFSSCPLEIKIVSYKQSSPEVQELLENRT